MEFTEAQIEDIVHKVLTEEKDLAKALEPVLGLVAEIYDIEEPYTAQAYSSNHEEFESRISTAESKLAEEVAAVDLIRPGYGEEVVAGRERELKAAVEQWIEEVKSPTNPELERAAWALSRYEARLVKIEELNAST